MKIVARDPQGILVRIEADELRKLSIQVDRPRDNWGTTLAPSEEIEAKLDALVGAFYEVRKVAGISMHFGRELRSIADTLDHLRDFTDQVSTKRLRVVEKDSQK